MHCKYFLQICEIKKKGLSQRDIDSRAWEDDCLLGKLRFSYGKNQKYLGNPLKAIWVLLSNSQTQF